MTTVPMLAPARTASLQAVVLRTRLHIDPQGTVEIEARRVGQLQGLIFDLDIANFTKPDSFQVVAVARDESNDLVVHFTHAHPFAAPDFSRAVSGTNRADLGYTGRLLILADESSESFFNDSVMLDPSLIVSPDGYVQAGPLLETTGLTNNTFPFVLLADESKDNRIGVSNGGSSTGNYNPATGGWTRANIGPNNNGWTGYDFVHQGQTVRNSFTVNANALAAGPIALETAIVIKYTDPRGGGNPAELKANRLPPTSPDFQQFAYRLPHAAMDATAIQLDNLATVPTTLATCGTVDFRYRDWDSLGVEGSDTNLSGEANLATIPPGAGSPPLAVLDAPTLDGGTSTAILREFGSGTPGSELQFTARVHNDLGTAIPGTHYACLQVSDPENGTDSAYHFGVDPNTFAPTRPSLQAAYQVVPITVVAPLGNVPGQPPGTISSPCEDGGQGGGPSIFNAPPFTNGPTTIEWNFGGGATPNTAFGANPLVNLTSTAGIYTGWVQASNAFGSSGKSYFTFIVDNPSPVNPLSLTLNPPPQPVLSGTGSLQFAVSAFDTPAPPLSVQFDWNSDGDYGDAGEGATAVSSVGQLFTSPITYTNPLPELTSRTIPYQYFDGASTPLTRQADYLLAGTPPPAGWAVSFGNTSGDVAEDVAVDAQGNCYVAGHFNGTVDFGGGPRGPGSLQNCFVVSLTPTGAYRWDQTVTSANPEQMYAIAVDGSGNVYAAGHGTSGINLGGGPIIVAPDINFVVKYNSTTGAYLAHYNTGTSGVNLSPNSIAYLPTNRVVIGGYFTSTQDFGGGVRTGSAGMNGYIVNLNATTLAHVWDRTISFTGAEGVTGVAGDGTGAVYATVNYANNADFGAGATPSLGGSDGAFLKYDAANVFQWARTFGTSGMDFAHGAGTSVSDGLVFFTGAFSSSGSIDLGGGLRPGGAQFVACYTSANAYQWDNVYPTVASLPEPVALPNGDVILGGTFVSTINFGGGLRASAGGFDCYWLRLQGATGAYIDDATWGGPSPEFAYGFAARPDGSGLLAGDYSGTVDFNPGPAVFNLTSAGASDGYVAHVQADGTW